MIMSPVNCSEKMSPYGKKGDIEREGTKTVSGTNASGCGGDDRKTSLGSYGRMLTPREATHGSLQEGGGCWVKFPSVVGSPPCHEKSTTGPGAASIC